MHFAKLSVTAVFVLFAALFLLGRGVSPSVSGKVLESLLDSPTGFSATDRAYANKVGLRWDAIRGATLYRVFRSTTNDSASAVEVGSTPANYFFDAGAVPETTYFYWVRSENGASISQFSSPDQGTRATGSQQPGPLAPLEPPTAPAGNSITAAKASLGKALFWDEQLSSTKTVSCGTCHRPAAGGSDPRTHIGDVRSQNPGFDNVPGTGDDVFGSPGVPQNYENGTYGWNSLFGMNLQVTSRKAPSYLNSAYSLSGIFWDGRAAEIFRDPFTLDAVLDSKGALESQTIFPPVAGAEMGHQNRDWNQVAARVAASKPLALASNVPSSLATWIGGRSYPELFQEAFGTPDVTPVRIAMAIATHERTLFSDQAPIDRALSGIEPLTAQEERGRGVFVNNCATCHSGPLLSDQTFHNIGVRPQNEDIGRNLVTGGLNDLGAFKTAVLRNVELRAPYFHNGGKAAIEDVVGFYDRGGDFPNQPNIDHTRIHPLNLPPGARADLAAFLRRPLTDDRVRNELPPFDRPQLFTESNHVPVISGTGRVGAGSLEPNPVAIEPPLVGNPSFTVAVNNALGGAQATVVIDSADPGLGATVPLSGAFARQQTVLLGAGTGGGYGSVVLQIPNDPAIVGQTFYGRWYVADPSAVSGIAVSRLFTFTVFGNAVVSRRVPFDFDGDGKTDIAVYRASLNQWWISRSSDNTVTATALGFADVQVVAADFTGDQKADVAVFRQSTGEWFIQPSENSSSYLAFPFGQSGDIPMPADYDGDGKADPAVFRPSTGTWYISPSSGGTAMITQFGAAGDQPVAADFDGDGKADIAIVRQNGANKEWWIQRSSAGLIALAFGTTGDLTVQGDYTGDGKADLAVFRPSDGNWYVLRSEDLSYLAFPWGANGDLPAPGDYDGDGKFDAAVFRQSSATWFINRTGGSGPLITNFGAATDSPVAGAFVR